MRIDKERGKKKKLNFVLDVPDMKWCQTEQTM